MTEQKTGPLRYEDADWAYIMSDDSMTGARIWPGDMVLVKQQTTVENGDIVLVLYNDEVRIGRYSKHASCEVLTPASEVHMTLLSKYENPSFKIIGKAIAFISALTCGEEVGENEQNI